MINDMDGIITFRYDYDEVFNDVGLLSAYMIKNVADENGTLLDDYAITEDEKDVFAICLKQALPNIWERLMKISSGVDNAFGIVTVEATEETEAGKFVEFNIKDNGAYNKNVLALVESTLNECIKYGVLTEFYSVNVNAELLRLSKSKFVENLNLLTNRLFQLKQKATSSLFAY